MSLKEMRLTLAFGMVTSMGGQCDNKTF